MLLLRTGFAALHRCKASVNFTLCSLLPGRSSWQRGARRSQPSSAPHPHALNPPDPSTHSHKQSQLAAREEQLAEGRATISAEQRRAKELETHKFVLTHKVEQVGAWLGTLP